MGFFKKHMVNIMMLLAIFSAAFFGPMAAEYISNFFEEKPIDVSPPEMNWPEKVEYHNYSYILDDKNDSMVQPD